MNIVKNARPVSSAIPAYESARPAISSAVGGGAEGPMSLMAGSGALMANANAPFVSWPSTAETVVHETRYPPSPIAPSDTRSVFGSSLTSATSWLSTRFPLTSSTATSLPRASGVSLNVTRTSVGGLVSRASDAGFDFT
jgi:hypothetical protein